MAKIVTMLAIVLAGMVVGYILAEVFFALVLRPLLLGHGGV